MIQDPERIRWILRECFGAHENAKLLWVKMRYDHQFKIPTLHMSAGEIGQRPEHALLTIHPVPALWAGQLSRGYLDTQSTYRVWSPQLEQFISVHEEQLLTERP